VAGFAAGKLVDVPPDVGEAARVIDASGRTLPVISLPQPWSLVAATLSERTTASGERRMNNAGRPAPGASLLIVPEVNFAADT
jgi:hypothetical protein